MGAEAAAAHAHAVLVAEDRGDQGVVDPLDGERDDPEPRRRAGDAGRTVDPEARHVGQAFDRVSSQLALVGRDLVEPDLPERTGGRGQRNGADDVRAARLFPVRKVGPDDGVGRDGSDRAPSRVIRRRAERATKPDEGAGAIRGVHLVR